MSALGQGQAVEYCDVNGGIILGSGGIKSEVPLTPVPIASTTPVQQPTEAVLVSGIDSSLGSVIKVTVTAARLVGAPLNPTPGQTIQFIFVQGGAGAFAITWNAIFKGKTWSDAGNAAAARSSVCWTFDGINWNQDGAQAPYAA
jgi:hypothetical protein